MFIYGYLFMKSRSQCVCKYWDNSKCFGFIKSRTDIVGQLVLLVCHPRCCVQHNLAMKHGTLRVSECINTDKTFRKYCQNFLPLAFLPDSLCIIFCSCLFTMFTCIRGKLDLWLLSLNLSWLKCYWSPFAWEIVLVMACLRLNVCRLWCPIPDWCAI